MKVKEFKEIVIGFPDDWEIGYTEQYEEGNVNRYMTKRFHGDLSNLNIDLKNKQISLYDK